MRVWLVGLLVSSLLFASVRVRGEEHVVRVAMASGDPLEPSLYATLRELAARIGLTLVDGATGVNSAWSSVRLSPSGDGGMDIMVAGEGVAPSVHRHVGPSATSEMQRETIAHVVLGILEPRLHAEQRRAEEAIRERGLQARAPKPEPSASSREMSSERRAHFLQPRAATSAGVAWMARERAAARVLAALGFVSDRRLEPSLALGLGATVLPRVSRRALQARMTVLSARLLPSITLLRARRFALELSAPAGCDLALFRLLEAPRSARTASNPNRVDPIAGAALSASLRVARSIDLTLTAGADFAFTKRNWNFQEGTRQATPLLSVEWVRPHLALGFAWTRERSVGSAP